MKLHYIGVVAALVVVLGSAARAETLADRYNRLSCAVVRVTSNGGGGTGFFVNETGRLVTAAHVATDRVQIGSSSGPALFAKIKPGLSVTFGNKASAPTLRSTGPLDLSDKDIAVLETGFDSSACFIRVRERNGQEVGEKAISIGFPGTYNTRSLLDGFVSSLDNTIRQDVDAVTGGKAVFEVNVMRIQMPIVPGISGSPLIDDQDMAFGVVIATPIEFPLRLLEFAAASDQNRLPTITLGQFDLSTSIADLTSVLHQYASPGSGFASPLSRSFLALAQ